FFFSSRRRHTRFSRDWSSDVCSSDLAMAAVVFVVMVPFASGFLRDYAVLLASLTSYGVSATVCVLMSFRNQDRFDFSLIAKRVRSEERRVGKECRSRRSE